MCPSVLGHRRVRGAQQLTEQDVCLSFCLCPCSWCTWCAAKLSSVCLSVRLSVCLLPHLVRVMAAATVTSIWLSVCLPPQLVYTMCSPGDPEGKEMLARLRGDARASKQMLLLAHMYATTDAASLAALRCALLGPRFSPVEVTAAVGVGASLAAGARPLPKTPKQVKKTLSSTRVLPWRVNDSAIGEGLPPALGSLLSRSVGGGSVRAGSGGLAAMVTAPLAPKRPCTPPFFHILLKSSWFKKMRHLHVWRAARAVRDEVRGAGVWVARAGMVAATKEPAVADALAAPFEACWSEVERLAPAIGERPRLTLAVLGCASHVPALCARPAQAKKRNFWFGEPSVVVGRVATVIRAVSLSVDWLVEACMQVGERR
jgi:hypothetical protein